MGDDKLQMLRLGSPGDPTHPTGILIKFISPLTVPPKCQCCYENLITRDGYQLRRHRCLVTLPTRSPKQRSFL